MNQPTLIDLSSDEYNQRLCYYPFIVILDTYNGSCNKLHDTSSRVCFANKAENVNLFFLIW